MSMGVPRETASPKFSVKLESEELERIVQARKNLDDVKALAIYGAQYQNLGWSPAALEASSGRDLNLDFSQPQTLRLLMDLALKRTRVQLAIRLETDSPLFVLRVRPALGRSLLDRLDNWRSPCVARLGDVWEHHFLALPQGWVLSGGSAPEDPLSVLGPGDLVLAPPSFDPAGQDAWRWLSPPWEQPPEPPGPELSGTSRGMRLSFQEVSTAPEDLPSWKVMFPVICHSDKVLQALLAPEESCELYYRKILEEAIRAGFRETGFLLGLLWHAPHGEARLVPEGRRHLSRWEAEIQRLLAAEVGHLSQDAPAAADPGMAGPALPGAEERPARGIAALGGPGLGTGAAPGAAGAPPGGLCPDRRRGGRRPRGAKPRLPRTPAPPAPGGVGGSAPGRGGIFNRPGRPAGAGLTPVGLLRHRRAHGKRAHI
jgi:hypothetical protein